MEGRGPTTGYDISGTDNAIPPPGLPCAGLGRRSGPTAALRCGGASMTPTGDSQQCAPWRRHVAEVATTMLACREALCSAGVAHSVGDLVEMARLVLVPENTAGRRESAQRRQTNSNFTNTVCRPQAVNRAARVFLVGVGGPPINSREKENPRRPGRAERGPRRFQHEMNYHATSGATSPHADIRHPKIDGQPLIDDDPKFESIVDVADMVASLARSIAEAALRADITLIRIHRAEFRHRASELMAAIKRVAPIDGSVA